MRAITKGTVLAILAACLMLTPILSQRSTRPRTKPRPPVVLPFYTGPFDPSLSSLPPNFQGHNLAGIYSLLQSRQANFKRGEFEGISAFLDRLHKEEAKAVLGNLSLKDLFVFTFTPSQVTYEMLEGRFQVHSSASSDRIIWRSTLTGDRYYMGHNAFGVKTRIHEQTFEDWTLKVNEDDMSMCGPSFFKECFENVAFLPMESGKASMVKQDIRFLAAGRIVAPYVSDDEDYNTPTINSPFSSIRTTHQLHIRPKMTAFYNIRTGEILSRRDFED